MSFLDEQIGDTPLDPVERREVEIIGTWLTDQPAALFYAGELIYLSNLAARGGASALRHLQAMRDLRRKIERRASSGFWLDPLDAPPPERPN